MDCGSHDRELTGVIDRLIGMSRPERATVPCIGDDRAELVISGAAIMSAILDHWPAERLRVADRGLREGLLYRQMNHDDALLPCQPRQARRR